MEPIMGALSEGECSYLSGMFSTEEADFMAQLLGNHPFSSKQDGGPNMGILSSFWPGHEASIMSTELGNDGSPFRLDIVNSNPNSFSQGSSYDSYSNGSSSLIFPTSGHENYYLSDSNQTLGTSSSSMSMDIFMRDEKIISSSVQVFPENPMEEAICNLNKEMISNNLVESGGDTPEEKQMQLKRKPEMLAMVSASEDGNNDNLPKNPKKKLRIAGEVKRINKNLQSKKNQNHVSSSTHEDESNAELNGHSSSNYCSSEDDSNASQELNGGTASTSKGSTALNSIGKTRASRGSATDPQSLYARKRRERINERLKILQSLVPNGTKVDISTMLEEAVQYVKFLQLQIKLLSSDDLWMYAPLAYNGMDIGLDLKISLPQ